MTHMMVAPNDLPGQDLSNIGALHIDNMNAAMNPPYDDGKGLKLLKAGAAPQAGRAAVAAAVASLSFPGTGYVFGQAPVADASAGIGGHFDQPVQWPLVGLHEILLPDGRVLNYGTNVNAANTFVYDIWDPTLGDSSAAHSLLPNTTTTDIFCSFQAMNWQSGEVLITGGDTGTTFRKNTGNNFTTIFSPSTNAIRSADMMANSRWYPSIVDMPNGDMVALGGYFTTTMATITPEVYNSNASPTWQTLSGAASNDAFGLTKGGWFFPKAWVSPRGDIFLIANTGKMYSISPVITSSSAGTITPYAASASVGSFTLPTVMYAPGKLFSLRLSKSLAANLQLIDINGPTPIVTTSPANPDQLRAWSTATVLADGRVAVTGGSTIANSMSNGSVVGYRTQIWDPATGNWTAGAVADKPRLYHSIALLLPDATLLTGSGGSPGPVTERNAEIYYPPYLYLNDGSGNPAPRPTLVSAPTDLTVGQAITATVGPTDVIERVTLIRAGSVTHSTNIDQRFFDATFAQSGSTLTVTTVGDPNVFVPGYYMMFAFQNRVPSVAKIIHVTPDPSVLSHPVQMARAH